MINHLSNGIYGIDYYFGNFLTVGRIFETRYQLEGRCAIGSDTPESIVTTMVRVSVWAVMAWESFTIPVALLTIYSINKIFIYFKPDHITGIFYCYFSLSFAYTRSLGYELNLHNKNFTIEELVQGDIFNYVDRLISTVKFLKDVSCERVLLLSGSTELSEDLVEKINEGTKFGKKQFVVFVTTKDDFKDWASSKQYFLDPSNFFCLLSPLDCAKFERGRRLSPAFINLLSKV